MTIRTRTITYLIIGLTTFCSAQIETYRYKRALSHITGEWHQITLPDEVFGKVNPDISDLKIYK